MRRNAPKPNREGTKMDAAIIDPPQPFFLGLSGVTGSLESPLEGSLLDSPP